MVARACIAAPQPRARSGAAPTAIMDDAVRVLALASRRVQPDPGIYSFLAATIPRLGATSPLRHLPLDCIQMIARFAHSSPYLAGFSISALRDAPDMPVLLDLSRDVLVRQLEDYKLSALDATRVDVSRTPDLDLRLARPIRRGMSYIEITVSKAWYGTGVDLTFGPRPIDEYRFSLGLNETEGQNIVTITHDSRVAITLFDESWTWGEGPVIFGMLVDLDRGRLTLYFNNIVGPCVKLPDHSEWRRKGVHLTVSEFPETDDDQIPGPIIVSCATPPVSAEMRSTTRPPIDIEDPSSASFREFFYAYDDEPL